MLSTLFISSLLFTASASATQRSFDLGMGEWKLRGEGKTTWSIVKSEARYSEFAKLASKFPRIIDQLSSSKYQHTLLVPSNEALRRVFVQGKDLEQVLDYHIINGRKTGAILGEVQKPGAKGLFSTHTSPGLLSGRLQMIELFYCSWNDAFYVGHSCRAAKVLEGSCETASNGVIYQVDKVLFPPEPMLATISNIQPYHAKGSLSMFVSALEISGMASGPTYIDGLESVTVFAPSNEAWVALGSRMTRFLMSPLGANVLQKIIQYHISPNHVAYSNTIGEGFTSLKTLLPGKTLSITERSTQPGKKQDFNDFEADRYKTVGNMMLNRRARVLTSDILTNNGVVHVIDQVLLPCGIEKMMEGGDLEC